MSSALRDLNIDYEKEGSSVTFRVAHNKSVFGAIVSSIRPDGSLKTLLKAMTGKEKRNERVAV